MAETVATYDFLSPPTQSGDLGALAHYRVIDELGKGGMGYVFRAEDSKLQRSVALKVMNQKIAATSNSRQRFLHEARAMAAVHHDNVATIFEVGESDGTPFMAMEMLKGGTLETLNDDKDRLRYEKIIDYAQQTARGLSAAHVKGIVHRDIKPANIWIEEGTDRIKILDFGLALASTPVDHLSGRGAVIGTPGYLSPEQARSEPLDDRSDLYSLGVVLYELATGQLPLQSGSVSGQLIAILAHRPPPIHELNPEIPKPLCDLIHRLLRKEPRMRPQSAAALNAELDQVREQCDATSEVAQAISKLKVGLTEVVSKSDTGSIVDAIDEFPDTVADPLSTIPAASASAVGTANSGSFAVPGTLAQQKAEPVGPNWKLYTPLLSVVAVLATTLLLLTFFFSQMDGSTGPNLVTQFPAANELENVAAATSEREAIVQAHQDAAAQQAANEPVDVEPRSDVDATKPSHPTQASLVAAQSTTVAKVEDTDPPTAEMLAESTLDPKVTESTATNEPNDSRTPVDPSPKPSEPEVARAEVAEPKATAPDAAPKKSPVPKFVVKVLSAADKNFADVTIRKGTTVNYGNKETISVWTRGGVEVEHTYIRFDLATIKSVKKTVNQAELILTVPGKRPLGSSIRLYGAKIKPKHMLWPEYKVVWIRSPSDIGTDTSPDLVLDDFPVLAEQTVTEVSNLKDRIRIRFSSPALTKFVAESTQDAITLVLAGSDKEGREKVEFVSSEDLKKQAPMLRVRFPEPPPAKAKDDKDAKKSDDKTSASKNSSPTKADQANRKRNKRKK